MRKVFFFLLLVLATPALAQQSNVCRGKQAFDLGDGAKGCIALIDTASITTTTTRDDGASSRSNRRTQARVVAAMTGANSEKRSVIKRRMIGICKTALPAVQSELAGMRYNRIILVMDWRASGGELQAGFSNAKCNGFSFFGTR